MNGRAVNGVISGKGSQSNNRRSNLSGPLLSRDYATFRPHIFDFLLKRVLPDCGRILDPMAGTAPILPIVTKSHIKGHFNDILPLHFFINKAKTFDCFLALSKKEKREKQFLFKEAMSLLRPLNRCRLMISRNWIHEDILGVLTDAWKEAGKYRDRQIGTILRAVILLCVRPYSCFTPSVSNHTWLKMGGMITGRPLKEIIREQISKLTAFYSFHYNDIHASNTDLITITCEDARLLTFQGKYDVIFTSPPYPNRFDPVAFYGPELFFLEQIGHAVKSSVILGKPLVRGYHNLEEDVDFIGKVAPSALSFLRCVINKSEKDEAEYYPRYFARYYSHLFRSIANWIRYLENKGAIYLVVQNNIHRGELNDMQKYVIEFFRLAGYDTTIEIEEVHSHLGIRNISAKYPLVVKKHIECVIRAVKK